MMNFAGCRLYNCLALWKQRVNLLLHAIINLRGVSTKLKSIYYIHHANVKELIADCMLQAQRGLFLQFITIINCTLYLIYNSSKL